MRVLGRIRGWTCWRKASNVWLSFVVRPAPDGEQQHIQACCPLPCTPPRRRQTHSKVSLRHVLEQYRSQSESCTKTQLSCRKQHRSGSNPANPSSSCARSDGAIDALYAHFTRRTCCCTDRPTKRAQRPPPGAPRAARPLAATADKDGRGAARARRRPSFERSLPTHGSTPSTRGDDDDHTGRGTREQSSKAHPVNNAKRMLGGMGGELRPQDRPTKTFR